MDNAIVDQLLTTTRAVRRKLDLTRPVELDVVMQCLRIAVQAPTAGPTQTWRWLVVVDQEQRNAVGALFREVGDAYLRRKVQTAGELADRPEFNSAMASARHLVDIIERIPVFVIPCVVGRPAGGNDELAVFYGGIFPAIWNFQLALRSRGLGSTLTTYHLVREAEAAAILGIPDDITQVALLPIAYTTTDEFRPGPRQPVETLTYLDRWGRLLAADGQTRTAAT